MIIIFSIDSDQSTNHVIDWLEYNKIKWERINAEDVDVIENFVEFPSCEMSKNRDSNTIWFRKWLKSTSKISYNTENSYLALNQGKEFDEYSKHLFFLHKEGFKLNKPSNLNVDKLTQLNVAQSLGLKIPCTLLTNNKEQLIKFFDKHAKVITKNLAANLCIIQNDEPYMSYTQRISYSDILEMDDLFCLSLFQEEIEKEIEIRSFFLEEQFYSMAIFSQSDPLTSVDFRQYNTEQPNRTIPFRLPREIEEKAQKLMEILEINCGSLDFIKSTSGEYYFLEINPLGQFGMTSYPCNYNLEKKIAEFLIRNDLNGV